MDKTKEMGSSISNVDLNLNMNLESIKSWVLKPILNIHWSRENQY